MSSHLPVPPVVSEDPEAVEVLRVWVMHDKSTTVTLDPVFADSAAWGILLVDIARHAARAHANDTRGPLDHMKEILAMFQAECEQPTDGDISTEEI